MNHRHADFQSAALPTELPGLTSRRTVADRSPDEGRGLISARPGTVHLEKKGGLRRAVNAALAPGVDGALLPGEERYGYPAAGIEGPTVPVAAGGSEISEVGPLFYGKVAAEGVEIDAPFGSVGIEWRWEPAQKG